jgi:hypothetical protein
VISIVSALAAEVIRENRVARRKRQALIAASPSFPRQKRGMRTRQAAVYSIGHGWHTISFGNDAP